MLISFWLGIFLFFVLCALLTFLGSKIAKKMNKPPAGGGGIGFTIGLGFIIYAFVGLSRCYVVTGDLEYTQYLVFGTAEYQIEGGATIDVEISSGHCFVINETSGEIVVEEIVYGAIFGGSTDWVYPGEGEEIKGGRISYFFDDEPPDEISVSDATDEVSKLWLRKRRL